MISGGGAVTAACSRPGALVAVSAAPLQQHTEPGRDTAHSGRWGPRGVPGGESHIPQRPETSLAALCPTADTVFRCGGCKRYLYCSSTCAEADWHRGHRSECGVLQRMPESIQPDTVELLLLAR
eukprot:COSAG02_NODE_8322_length_2615_cov_1.993641_2_plen_124_part_00